MSPTRIALAALLLVLSGQAAAQSWGPLDLLNRTVPVGEKRKFPFLEERTFEGSFLDTAIFAARGARPGPTLCLTALVHGDERNGFEVARTAFAQTDARQLAGTLIALPAMLKAGYDQKLSSGVITAGGTLGILIPPSILLIVYAATASVSVVKMYAAAIIPGFVLAGLYMVYVITRAVINPSLCPKPKEVQHYTVLESVLLVLKAFVPLAALILAVLGSILFGLATPSEAAAMGALGGIVLAVVYRAFTWDRLRESVYLTARTSAMVCFLFVGAATFASVFSYLGGEHLVKDVMLGMDLTPLQFLLLAQLIIFILGWPLEWSEIIIIFVPIFLPLLPVFGIDPVLFGILIAINLQTSFLTPPMAMSAYYLKGIAPKGLELWTIFRGCFPFVGMVLVTLALTYIFPAMVTYLPDQFFNQAKEIPIDPDDESVVNPDIFKTN